MKTAKVVKNFFMIMVFFVLLLGYANVGIYEQNYAFAATTNAVKIDGAAIIINDTIITYAELDLWDKIFEEKQGEISFNKGRERNSIEEIIDIYLLSEEFRKKLTAKIASEKNLVAEISFWSNPASWLKRKNEDEELAAAIEDFEWAYMAELFGFSPLRHHKDKVWRAIREEAIRLDESFFDLKDAMIRLALAEQARKVLAEDVKQIFVSPREIKIFYEKNRLEFQKFQHALIKKESFGGNWEKQEYLAAKIAEKLGKEEYILNLCADYGINFQQYSCESLDDFIPEIQALVRKIKEDEVGYVGSKLGLHIIQLQPMLKFSEIQEEIVKRISEEKVSKRKEELIFQLRKSATVVIQ